MNKVIEVHGGRRLIIPVGLPELMNDIGKEVIKHQPENLLEFIANYLERRVDQLRRRDPLRIDTAAYLEIERSLPRETRIILDGCGIDLFTAEKAATTIQATFRGFLTRQRLKKEKHDCAKCESDHNAIPPDNIDTLPEKLDERMDSVIKVIVEKSSTTIGSAIYAMPEVDFKTSKPSIDLTSNYEQVSLIDYEDENYRFGAGCDQERPSFTHSMISTNTITRDMQQESNTYLDLTEVYRKSIDPFKEVEQAQAPAVITSDLEIFKHIDLENYEDTNKTYEHFNTHVENKGFGGDDVSSSQITSENSTQKSSILDDFEKGYSLDKKSLSPRTSEPTRKSQDNGADLKEKYSPDDVTKSPSLSSGSKNKDDGDKAVENSGKVVSHEDITLNLAETENEGNA